MLDHERLDVYRIALDFPLRSVVERRINVEVERDASALTWTPVRIHRGELAGRGSVHSRMVSSEDETTEALALDAAFSLITTTAGELHARLA
jgi:hypothetical protein